MWREVITPERGGDHTSDTFRQSKDNNIILALKPEQSTSRSHTLARLKRERPDLFERVVDGELRPTCSGRGQHSYRIASQSAAARQTRW
jgi:hypothetical protein